MIPNCDGCKEEYNCLMEMLEAGYNFAGKGFNEKGHLDIIIVNDKGEIIIG